MTVTRELQQSRAKVRSRIEIDMKKCLRCAICVELCPRDVLGLSEDGSPEVVNLQNCTACRLCELRCPDICIFVKEEASLLQ